MILRSSEMRVCSVHLKAFNHMSFSLNFLKGGYIGDYIGDYYRGY